MRVYSGAVGIGMAAAIIGGLSAPLARAQCSSAPVTIQVTTIGTYANTCTLNAATGHWDITVTINGPVTTNSTINIRGASTLLLGKVTIQNNSAIDTRVNILGSGFDQRIGGVGFIDKGTSAANRVLLLQLDTVGDVGYDRPGPIAIHADMISNLSVGGNVLGALVSDGVGRHMQNSFIQGDLRGNISMGASSSIDSLWIGGNLGLPNEDPVRVYVSGNLKNLTAAAINADITTLANGAAGTVHSIDVTTGAFKGSLIAHRLGFLADGAGPAMFHVAGDLDASFTIMRDMRVPFSVGGTFRQSRLVAGAPVANVFSAGTGLFDDVGASPSSNMTITGDFAASMVLGAPLSAGLSSINRDLNIGGSLTGTITTAQDVDANINVGGVGGSIAAGSRIDVGGSLRSTRTISTTGPLAGTISLGSSLLGAINMPAAGLQGQIVMNAANAGGTWVGTVMIGGSSVFSPVPYYTTKSVNFGGGAVGLAPFKAHLDDCTPAHNSNGSDGFALQSEFGSAANTPVRFRAYGPMQPPTGSTIRQCTVIEQQVGANWVDRSVYFSPAFLPTGPTGRIIGFATAGSGTPLPPIGQYRIRNVSMQSAGVTGNPGIVWTTPYLFRIDTDCNHDGLPDSVQIASNPVLDANADGIIDTCQVITPSCPCDFNHSGGLSVQDVFDYLGAYFAASPMADFNMSGSVTIQDIFDFLGCYFTHPAGC